MLETKVMVFAVEKTRKIFPNQVLGFVTLKKVGNSPTRWRGCDNIDDLGQRIAPDMADQKSYVGSPPIRPREFQKGYLVRSLSEGEYSQMYNVAIRSVNN